MYSKVRVSFFLGHPVHCTMSTMVNEMSFQINLIMHFVPFFQTLSVYILKVGLDGEPVEISTTPAPPPSTMCETPECVSRGKYFWYTSALWDNVVNTTREDEWLH